MRCVVSVGPGLYRIEVEGDRGVPSAARELKLLRPGTLEVRAGSKALREAGTATWIVGIVAMGLGLAGMTFAGARSSSSAHSGAGIVLGSGVLVTLTGFVMVDRAATTVSFRF